MKEAHSAPEKYAATADGMIVKGLGGLYTVLLREESVTDPILRQKAQALGFSVACNARGAFRHAHLTPTVGDRVTVAWDRDPALLDESLSGGALTDILPRKNHLLRPPVCNLDRIYMVVAAAEPTPELYLLDKLIAVAEYKKIEPVIVITKADREAGEADRIAEIYRTSGFTVFVCGLGENESYGQTVSALRSHMLSGAEDALRVYAFAGVSGAGKSTLMNRLFPGLELATGGVSKIMRGRHTTRHVEFFSLAQLMGGDAADRKAGSRAFLADTPGFSLLDVVNNDYFTKEELPDAFREFEPYPLGSCRYTKCTHLKEEGCAILAAVERGEIPQSRHESYKMLYAELKDKHEWDKKSSDTVNRNGKIAGKAGNKQTYIKK